LNAAASCPLLKWKDAIPRNGSDGIKNGATAYTGQEASVARVVTITRLRAADRADAPGMALCQAQT
jgi:hypothetical protein